MNIHVFGDHVGCHIILYNRVAVVSHFNLNEFIKIQKRPYLLLCANIDNDILFKVILSICLFVCLSANIFMPVTFYMYTVQCS